MFACPVPDTHRVLVCCLCLPPDLVSALKKKKQTLVPYAFITLIFWYFHYVYSLIYFILYLQNIILRTGVLFHTVEEWFISRLVKELLSGGWLSTPPGSWSPFKKVGLLRRGSSKGGRRQADVGPENLAQWQRQQHGPVPSRFSL